MRPRPAGPRSSTTTSPTTFSRPRRARTGCVRWGSGEVRIERVELLDAAGRADHARSAPATRSRFRLHYDAHEPVVDGVFGLASTRIDGVEVTGPEHPRRRARARRASTATGYVDFRCRASCSCPAPTTSPSRSTTSAALHPYDHVQRALRFEVEAGDPVRGVRRRVARRRVVGRRRCRVDRSSAPVDGLTADRHGAPHRRRHRRRARAADGGSGDPGLAHRPRARGREHDVELVSDPPVRPRRSRLPLRVTSNRDELRRSSRRACRRRRLPGRRAARRARPARRRRRRSSSTSTTRSTSRCSSRRAASTPRRRRRDDRHRRSTSSTSSSAGATSSSARASGSATSGSASSPASGRRQRAHLRPQTRPRVADRRRALRRRATQPPRHARTGAARRRPGHRRPTTSVILWGGGIYNWFDPLTLLRAVDRLRGADRERAPVLRRRAAPEPRRAGEMRDGRRARARSPTSSGSPGRTCSSTTGSTTTTRAELPARGRRRRQHATSTTSRPRSRSAPASSTTCGPGLPTVTTQGDVLAELIDRAAGGHRGAAGGSSTRARGAARAAARRRRAPGGVRRRSAARGGGVPVVGGAATADRVLRRPGPQPRPPGARHRACDRATAATSSPPVGGSGCRRRSAVARRSGARSAARAPASEDR